MKAYPVIYSRTKHVDFLPDFIVKPTDLNFNGVNRYINNVNADLETVSGVRYFAFPAERYVVFGIACYSKILAELVLDQCDIDKYSDFISDDKRRRVSCVIGYAVPTSETADVPCVSLRDYWDSYIALIKDQWFLESRTQTTISSPITLKIRDLTKNIPEFSPLGGENVIKSPETDAGSVASIFVKKILNRERSSFISDVNTTELFDKLAFTHATISEELERKIKRAQITGQPETRTATNTNSTTSDMTTTFGNMTASIKDEPNPTIQQSSKLCEPAKFNISSFGAAAVAAGIVALVIFLLIILL